MTLINERTKYLELLSTKYPNIRQASQEITLLEAGLEMTKGSDIFISDIHGEYEVFDHLIRNGSGLIKQKVVQLLAGSWSAKEIDQLASVIYYPIEKIELIKKSEKDIASFYKKTILAMIKITSEFLCSHSSRNLDRIANLAYGELILELLIRIDEQDKSYSSTILKNLVELDQADDLIHELAFFIQRLSINTLHVIGDVYDRGPSAELILDRLLDHHATDFQWGNHDILWMGAAKGSEVCIASVLRLSLRYGNTDTLETGYGIHLMPLAAFAITMYKDDSASSFLQKTSGSAKNTDGNWLNSVMHKAIAIIQFKLEGQLLKRRPDFGMDDRLLLGGLDSKKGVVTIDGHEHILNDSYFPTIDESNPYQLTEGEKKLVGQITKSFTDSERLQKHADFLFEKGSMYKVTNDHLLYHGCLPLNAKGNFEMVRLGNKTYGGKALMDYFNVQMNYLRTESSTDVKYQHAIELVWYLWAGSKSPLFGKDKMATFERYFLNEPTLSHEQRDPYYDYRDDPKTCDMILKEFGLYSENAIILNGHVPVSVKKGESPVKADGKLVVIDGGFSKSYQHMTGIAGYTLVHDRKGRQLIAHEPFDSRKETIKNELDIDFSKSTLLTTTSKSLKAKDMPDSEGDKEMIKDLRALINCYRSGLLNENTSN